MYSIIGLLFVLLVLLFLTSIYTKDNSKIDVFWGLGFVVIAWGMYFTHAPLNIAQWSVVILVTLWWLRLAGHILSKKLKKSWEDPRYAGWRKQWKYFYLRSFFQVYILQGVLMCIVATPIFLLYQSSFDTSVLLTLTGLAMALFGWLYEIRADYELSVFMKHKKKWEILTSGLRQFHRYPQYFGESVFWFWICVIASQVSLLAFIWWAMITVLVRFVSGVPLLEKRYEGNKKYAQYSKHTNVFFPKWWG